MNRVEMPHAERACHGNVYQLRDALVRPAGFEAGELFRVSEPAQIS
jgi:hypothetical protein